MTNRILLCRTSLKTGNETRPKLRCGESPLPVTSLSHDFNVGSSSKFDPQKSNRFRSFKGTICSICEKRMIDCGCSLADENPAFKALTGFFRMMEIARESNYTGSSKWVVIHLAGGIGNQLLQIVSGLMLALATGRLVAIEDRDKDAENLPGGHEFMFDSVLLFPYVYNLQLPMNASRPNSKITAEIEGLSWLLCKN